MPPKKVPVKESNPKEAKGEKRNDGTPAVAQAVDDMAGDAEPKLLLPQKHRHKAGSPPPVRTVVHGATGAVPQPPPPANSVPKKDRLGRCHLVQKELINKLDDPFFKAKNVKDIPESVQSLYTDAVLDTLLGVTRCAACGCTIAQHRETADTALEILCKAEEGRRATALDWVFSNPQLTSAENFEALQASFKRADRVIERTVQEEINRRSVDSRNRQPLLIGIQAGMGIGKSFSIDMASQLLFVDKNPLVLKVTYNREQSFSEAEENNWGDGLLARLAISVKRHLTPSNTTVVMEMLTASVRMTTPLLVDFVKEHRENRPVIFAVDEIGCAKSTECVRSVLSTLTQVMLGFIDADIPCRGIVTALPSVDITSHSHRGLEFVQAPILTPDHSMSLLKSVLGDRSRQYAVTEMKRVLSYCNGHPRSLVMAGKLMSGYNKSIPTPEALANECQWKHKQGPSQTTVVTFLLDQYEHGRCKRKATGSPATDAAMDLANKNVLFTSGDGNDDIIPPIILFAPQVSKNDEDKKDGLRFVKRMFLINPAQSPPKTLEDVHMNWDYFRCQYRLPVVPPTMWHPNRGEDLLHV